MPHGVHDNRFEKPEVTLDPCCESLGLESNASVVSRLLSPRPVMFTHVWWRRLAITGHLGLGRILEMDRVVWEIDACA